MNLLSHRVFSVNPSIAFLWAILLEAFYLMKESELDKHFSEIIRDAEENMQEEDEFVSVAVVEDKAYWVINNMFYQADIIDGEVDKTSSRPVDAFQMSSKEINKMLYILDNLSEG